jgi:gas vesicle protein
MRFIIIIGGVVFAAVAASRLLRRKRQGPVRRARREIKRAVGQVDGTLQDLSKRAKKLSGEALETVEVQMRALESRRQDLIDRLQTAAEESKKARKKAKQEAAAAA